jgi:signal transduction histidine kinase
MNAPAVEHAQAASMPPEAAAERRTFLGRYFLPVWSSFALRLSLWYAAVFTVSAAILFVLLYLLLTSFFERSEREVITARLKECAALYENRGLPALNDLVHRDAFTREEGSFFVRVISTHGSVLLLVTPADWLRQVGTRAASVAGGVPAPARPAWLRLPKDDRSEFVIASEVLGDGVILQVGRSTNRSVTLLRPFLIAFGLGVGPTLLLGLVCGVIFAYRATAPAREVLRTARKIISTGNLAERVPQTRAVGDLAELARQFNRVLDKNQALIGAMRQALDNVWHDLRTPLTRLRASAETALQSDAPPEAAREALADCAEESERVLTMLNALMDITEAESGMMTLHRQHVSVAALLEQVLELYSLVAEEKRITVQTALDGPCEADLDPNRMRQAFANLIDNALKYTPSGGQVFVGCGLDGAAAVSVVVRDTGIGISPREQPRIWERLYRGDRSRSERGLGLGLSLVKAVIEAHGGQVDVTSDVAAGAEFRVTLPIAAEPL